MSVDIKENNKRYKLGACIELWFYITRMSNDFKEIVSFLELYNDVFENQDLYNIKSQILSIRDLLTYTLDILINDIDKTVDFCKYLKELNN